MIIVC